MVDAKQLERSAIFMFLFCGLCCSTASFWSEVGGYTSQRSNLAGEGSREDPEKWNRDQKYVYLNDGTLEGRP